MFSERARDVVRGVTREIKEAGTWKEERLIASPQGVEIVVNGRRVLNFCANNYLGLSSHPEVLAASKSHGFGSLETRARGLSGERADEQGQNPAVAPLG